MKKAIVATKVGMTQIFNEEISEQAGKRTLRKSRYRE